MPYLFCALVVLLLLYILGKPIILAWGTEVSYPGDAIFNLIVVLLVVQIIVHPANTLIMATSNHGRYAFVALFEGFLNLGLSVLWVGDFGLAGIVFATIIGRVISCFYMYLFI